MARRLLLSMIAACLAGCGGGGEDASTPARPAEKADPPAKLPPRWHTETNPLAGFTIGVPPAWTSRREGTTTLLGSPDKLVAVSVSADRTDEALSTPLDEFATDTVENLAGFENLKVTSTHPYKGFYPGVLATARGVAESGVRQRLVLVILRRERIAAYPVLAAISAGRRSPFAQQADPIIRSLRGRPVETSG